MLHCLYGGLYRSKPGDHNHDDFRVESAHFIHQLQSAHHRHHKVHEHQVVRSLGADHVPAFLTVYGNIHGEPFGREDPATTLTDAPLIVYDKDICGITHKKLRKTYFWG